MFLLGVLGALVLLLMPTLGLAQEPTQGTLKVNSKPPGAHVSLNGRKLGVTPLTLKVPAGKKLRIEVSLDKTQTHGETVTVKAGETAEVFGDFSK